MKKLNLDLSEIDGNAFSLLAHFKKQARANGWTKEEQEKVITNATSGDYDYLIQTLLKT